VAEEAKPRHIAVTSSVKKDTITTASAA
jgi:hypothetical protein